MSIRKITGVYHADGGLMGELRYVVGKLRGTSHCALCDVTHGLTGKKAEFVACEKRLGMPVELVHLNERTPELRAFTEGRTPCVVGHGQAGFVMLLSAEALDTLDGRVDGFERALRAALSSLGAPGSG